MYPFQWFAGCWLCILSNGLLLGLLLGDNWLCILSNGVLLGLLLGRQLVVWPVKLCAAGVVSGETIGCVSCQMVCWTLVVYPVKWCAGPWLCILSNGVLDVGTWQSVCWSLLVYPVKCCVAGVITGRPFPYISQLDPLRNLKRFWNCN